jgi:beta-1,4-N-acetylglucosaminyltransferase
MRVFVTVGSTHFDDLVEAVLRLETLNQLYAKGYRELVIQAGETKLSLIPPGTSAANWTNLLDITVWKYKPSLLQEFEEADLVISHAGAFSQLDRLFVLKLAGSGTILEVLRVPKPLIAVPNPCLLHNHQEELAAALHSLGYLVTATIQYVALKLISSLLTCLQRAVRSSSPT